MDIYYNVKQITSFIHAFKEEIYGKLKNIFLEKPPSISKNKHIFDSFKLICIRLDWSTLVFILLH